MRQPKPVDNATYIIWLRNPISRFISAFNHSKALSEFDVSTFSKEELFDSATTPYYKLTNKIENKFNTGCPFAEWPSGERYEELLSYFESANSLAESISSQNPKLKNAAIELMNNSEVEHIGKSIGWYLDDGKFIDRVVQQIIMVGLQESMSEDVTTLCQLTNSIHPDLTPVRAALIANDSLLSTKGVRNLRNFYLNTDYAAVETIKKYKLISENHYEILIK